MGGINGSRWWQSAAAMKMRLSPAIEEGLCSSEEDGRVVRHRWI
jgi:hypothetical protein